MADNPIKRPCSSVIAEPLPEWGRDICERINTSVLGTRINAYREISSTNDHLKKMAIHGAPEGYTIIARTQLQARGQHGRVWYSPLDKGLYMSVLVRPPWPSSEGGWLAIMSGVSVAQMLQDAGLDEISIKWPNDILCRGKKIAGILVEPRIGAEYIEFAVIGVGLNLAQTEKDWENQDLRMPATSCIMEGHSIDEVEAAVRLLESLDKHYLTAIHDGRDALMEQWISFGGTDKIPSL